MKVENILNKINDRQPSLMDQKKNNTYAVLVPLVEQKGSTHLLFEVRSLKMRRQPGDVCFPGGRVDQEDVNEEQCAIRETSEELGLDQSFIQHVSPLDYIISTDRRMIYPFVGRITNIDQMKINRAEVEEIFTVPLSYFLQTEPKKYKINFEVVPEPNFPFDLIQDGENYDWRSPQVDELFYEYEDKVIWGLTAKIIHHFMEIIRAE